MGVKERYEAKKKNLNANTVNVKTESSIGVKERYEAKKEKRTLQNSIKLDTLQTDLTSVSKAINDAYSGWQSRDTMKSTLSSVQNMYDRLGRYQQYQKKHGGADLSELQATYKSILDDWEGLERHYGQYKSADAYNDAVEKAKKQVEEYEGMKTADLGAIQEEITNLEGLVNTANEHKNKMKGMYARKDNTLNAALNEYKDYLASIGYASGEDLEKALGEKKVYLNRAKRLQRGIELSSVADVNSENYDKDYKTYSEQGRMLGEEEKPWWEGGYKNQIAHLRANPDELERYEKISGENGPIIGSALSSDINYLAAKYMTDSEAEIYNYYIGRQDAEGAEEYLKSIEEGLKQRQGSEIYRERESLLSKYTYGYTAGIDQFTQGMINAFNTKDDYIPTTGIQNASALIRDDIQYEHGNLGQVGYDLINTTSNMLPSILTSYVIGKINPAVGAKVGAGLMGASAAGNAYQEMLNLGYDKGQARTYSTLVGLSEATLQNVMGGIGKLGGVSGKLSKAVSGIDNGLAKFAVRWGGSALSEGFEEAAQEVLNPLLTNIAAGYETGENVDWSEVVYSGLLGALSGGVLEGGGVAINSYHESSFNKNMGQKIRANERVSDLFDIASDPETASAYEAYTRYAKKGINAENITDAQLGNLYSKAKEDAVGVFSRKSTEEEKAKAGKTIARLSGLEAENKVAKRVKELHTGEETKVTKADATADIRGIRTDKDKTVVITNHGETLVDDMTFSQKDAELVGFAEQIAKEEGDDFANLFVGQYDGKADVDAYATAFHLVTAYARNDYTYDTILKNKSVLSTEQVKAIYAETRIKMDAEKTDRIQKLHEKMADTMTYQGLIDDSVIDYENASAEGKVNWKDLTPRQKQAVTFVKGFAQATGMNLRLISNGLELGINGAYEVNNNTITLDIYAGIDHVAKLEDTIIPVMSHETTHWMEEKSPELWRRINELVFTTLQEADGISEETRIAKEIIRLEAKHGKKATEKLARSEIIARACEDMLARSEQGKKMFASLSESEQKTFIEKIKEVIQNLKEWISKLLSEYQSGSYEAKQMRQCAEKLDELSELWDEMLVESVKANQVLEKSGVYGSEINIDDIKFQTRSVNGRQVVWIDDNILKANQGQPVHQFIADFIAEHIGDVYTLIESGQKVYIGEDLPGEYTQSKYTKSVLKKNPNIIKVKNRVASNIGEIIEIATNRRWEKTKHITNKDAKYGMYRYNTRFGFSVKNSKGEVIGANIYNAELLIRNASDGRKYLYDIVGIKKDTVSSDWMSKKTSSAAEKSAGQKNNASNDSIPDSPQNVNTKFSDRDSDGRELSPAQQEYFKESAVRDEDGNLLVMYHGTPNAGFTKFKSGTYFTQHKWYADRYQNQGASSLGYKKTADNPDTYAVYLNIKKPFDTRNKAERDIFYNEYYRQWGMGTDLMESGLPDWMDGADLQEFLEENGYDYDGLILDEGSVGGYGDEVVSRGISYVTFYPEQVKSVDNLNPTEDEDIRYSDRDNDSYIVSQTDVETLRSIGRKSINEFNTSDMKKAEPFARKMWKELGIKSPFFRAWFGDWREGDIKTKVGLADIPQYIDSNEERKKNRGDVVNSDTKWIIRISREGETNTISHSGENRLSEYGLSGIRSLIENAVFLDSEVHEHHSNNAKNDLIMFDHKLYALGIDENGTIALYKITVEEYYQSKREPSNKRFHNLKYIEKVADNVGGRTFEKTRSGGSTNDISTTNYSVADLFGFVKRYDKEFKPKQASIVVDAKGIPKLVYHSTDAKFDTFDITKSRSWDGTPDYDLPGFYFSESFDDSAAYGGTIGEYYIKITNPYEGSVYALAKEKGSYRKAYDYLIAHDYDGVIDDELGEGFNEYIVLKPENIKSATDNIGTFDSENPNTKYSDRDDTSVYDVMGENERIKSENEILRADIERLNEMLKLEKQVTKGRIFNNNSLLAAAGHIRKTFNSGIDKVELARMLKEVYTFMQDSENLSSDGVFAKCMKVARDVMAKIKPVVTVDEYHKAILKNLRKTRVSFSEAQKAEAAHIYGKNWNRNFMGKITLANDGVPLESLWQEWSSMYPELFDAEATENDMVQQLFEAVETARRASEIYAEYDFEEEMRSIAIEIYANYWSVSRLQTTADKYSEKIKQIRAEHRKAMSELRKTTSDEVKKQRMADDIHFGKLMQKLREQKENEVARARELGKARLTSYKENAERKTRIQRITANALSLNEMLVKNSKDKHIPEIMREPVIELLQAIDFSSKRLLDKGIPTQKDISLHTALRNVKDMISKAGSVQGELVALYGTGLDEEIERMVKAVDIIRNQFGDNEFVLNRMSVEDLQTLDKTVRAIKHAVNQLNQFHVVNHAKGIANLSQQSMQDMDELGEGKVFAGRRGSLQKLMNWNNVLPVSVFKWFGEGGKKIFEALQDGWDKFAFNVKKIIDFTNSVYTDKEVETWENEIKSFKILVPARPTEMKTPGYEPKYQTVQMTVAQIMSLYCLNRRQQGQLHLYQGGIRIANIETKKGEIIAQSEGILLTEKSLQAILNSLTKRQKEVAEKLQHFMSTVCAEWGNEVSMSRFGYRAFGEENYFPIQSDQDNIANDDATEQQDSLFRILNMSFTKSIDPNSKNRIIVSDIFDVFAKHTSNMAKYHSLALPVLDAFKWYNYTEKEDIAEGTFNTTGVKQSIRRAFGEDGQSYFTTFLRDINGQNDVSRDTFGKGFFTNAKIAAVGANLRVVFLQPTSYVRAYAVLDAKYLTRALIHKPKIKQAETYCGIAQWKSLGYYDTNIQRGVAEQIKHSKSAKDKWVERAMKGAERADKITWGFLWNACELEVRDKRKDLKVGSQEFFTEVGKRLREVIYETQVVDSTMTRSQLMRSTDGRDKFLSAFASEPTLAYNMLRDAIMDFQLDKRRVGTDAAVKKNVKRILRTLWTYTITNAFAALIESGFDAYREDDDEEMDAETFMKLYLSNFGYDMSITAKLPYLKELISAFRGFSSSRLDTQWMDTFAYTVKSWGKLLSGGGNPVTTIKNTLKTISYLSGLPFYNAYRDTMSAFYKLDLLSEDDLNDLLRDIIE